MLNQGELHALRKAAEQSWGDDTRHNAYHGSPLKAAGQCYVTSRWLKERLGGHVAKKDGHYFWLSKDKKKALDLTGDQFKIKPENPALEGFKADEDDEGLQLDPIHSTWRTGPILYKNFDHPYFADHEIVNDADYDDERSSRFINRANREFENLGSENSRIALDYAGDSHPGQEPQMQEDISNRYWHDEPVYNDDSEYKFVYANGKLEVSPGHDHEELAGHTGIEENHTGPMAVGYVSLMDGRATWEVKANISPKALERVFKDYGKHLGWDWGGISNLDGEPVGGGSEFLSSYRFRFAKNHLYLGTEQTRDRDLIEQILNEDKEEKDIAESFYGNIKRHGQKAEIHLFAGPQAFQSTHRPSLEKTLSALGEWSADNGLQLVGANDNVIKTIEDLDQDNIYSPDPHQKEKAFFPDSQGDGLTDPYECEYCGESFPDEFTFESHQEMRHGNQHEDGPREDGQFPDLNPDAPSPFQPHFTPQQPETMALASVKQASRVDRAIPLDDHDYYVAFKHGCAVGMASVKEGSIDQLHNATQDPSVDESIIAKLEQYNLELKANVRTADSAFKRRGWLLTNGIWKWAAGKAPKDLIDGDMPFIYDVQEDAIYVGNPGEKTSQIPGKFTPGGIVEGTYEPGGKVFIRSMTNMPYSVRHVIELFYWQHPELEVGSVSLRDDDGQETKLAAEEHQEQNQVGAYVKVLAAADPVAHAAQKALQQAGGQVYAVGGAVRDAMLGNTPKDIDLMVSGLEPKSVRSVLEQLPGRVDLTGDAFGVFRYRQGKHDVEIALPRKEQSNGVGHQDFDVQVDHTMPVEDDLGRRDFTANAMAVDLATGQLVDPYNGAGDIAEGKLRAVHDHSMHDDPLRVARALVAHARHGLEPDEYTRAQMFTNADSLTHLPAERIQAELDKIMASPEPAKAIVLAHRTGVLRNILPEVDDCFGYDQNNPHHELELGDHLVSVLKRTARTTDDPDVRLAALLHDIGKPDSAWTDPVTGSNHYYAGPEGQGANHEDVGADLAEFRMKELRYPNDRTQRVKDLIQHHMISFPTTPKGARRFLNKVGPHADDLMILREADQGQGKGKDHSGSTDVSLATDLINQTRQEAQPTGRAQLAVNGRDLMDAGIAQGPELGAILNKLTDAVVDDPSLNNKETLIEMAKQ